MFVNKLTPHLIPLLYHLSLLLIAHSLVDSGVKHSSVPATRMHANFTLLLYHCHFEERSTKMNIKQYIITIA